MTIISDKRPKEYDAFLAEAIDSMRDQPVRGFVLAALLEDEDSPAYLFIHDMDSNDLMEIALRIQIEAVNAKREEE